MEEFWDSICKVLERRYPTLKFRWDLNIDNNGIDFRIEKPGGVYILVFFDNKYIGYDPEYEYAIVSHILDIIYDKFQEDQTMEKIRINKKIFISRPMNGVTKEEDNRLVEEVRETLIKEGVLGKSVNTELVNTWDGPFVPNGFSDEQARVWRLGRAVSEMATADVLIFVEASWGAKGCQVELEVYNMYKNIMQKQWREALVYNPNEKTLRYLSDVKNSGRYPWGSGKNSCIDTVADLIAELACHGYSNELVEDAVNLSKKILDVGRTKI